MKMHAALLLLLVGFCAIKAHDVQIKRKAGDSSHFQTSAAYDGNSSKQDAVDKHSIVENWSLVCEELCGAGYGGPACGNECNLQNIAKSQPHQHQSIDFCPILCDFQLGGKNCDCIPEILIHLQRNASEICEVVCNKFNIRYSGCSLCAPNNSFDQIEHKLNNSTYSSTTIEPDPPKTISSTTTTESPPITSTITSTTMGDSPSTAPDWDAICKELCKKGEGGQLCKCDQAPFMSWRDHD